MEYIYFSQSKYPTNNTANYLVISIFILKLLTPFQIEFNEEDRCLFTLKVFT